ncbi:uracil-DNA glycosylase [Erysipelothrix urinaevulpis]|nr:uracil-DNA glycosylase [Erysipelothrix urinaevulpis]
MNNTWKQLIEEEKAKTYFNDMMKIIDQSRQNTTVYPAEDNVFSAFELCPFEDIKVVVIGQDPYHQPNQAMGLSFSVMPETPLPKSLINIFKELEDDLGVKNTNGDLSHWAKQGVFLINNVLTVEESTPLSHRNIGWETFTDRMMKELNEKQEFLIFVLWGKEAQKKTAMIDHRHKILCAPHPSPLSSYRGFFGSKPFSTINKILKDKKMPEIDWRTDV